MEWESCASCIVFISLQAGALWCTGNLLCVLVSVLLDLLCGPARGAGDTMELQRRAPASFIIVQYEAVKFKVIKCSNSCSTWKWFAVSFSNGHPIIVLK